MVLHSQNSAWQCRSVVQQDRKLFTEGRKGVLHDRIFLYRYQRWRLAEGLSISFLRFSTITSVKKPRRIKMVLFLT